MDSFNNLSLLCLQFGRGKSHGWGMQLLWVSSQLDGKKLGEYCAFHILSDAFCYLKCGSGNSVSEFHLSSVRNMLQVEYVPPWNQCEHHLNRMLARNMSNEGIKECEQAFEKNKWTELKSISLYFCMIANFNNISSKNPEFKLSVATTLC